jgi:hypothetical protein
LQPTRETATRIATRKHRRMVRPNGFAVLLHGLADDKRAARTHKQTRVSSNSNRLKDGDDASSAVWNGIDSPIVREIDPPTVREPRAASGLACT